MKCIICGGNIKLVKIIKLKNWMEAFDRGKIIPEDIESENVYCNRCFESVIWMKGNKNHED